MITEPNMPPDREQRARILTELDRNMLVEAAAGTGKTASMVRRMVELLRSGSCADIRSMAAVTFTRKAAAELRARFQVAFEGAVRRSEGEEHQRLSVELDRIEQCFIGTIHSFCGRLLRERPVEAGVDIAFEEIDQDTDDFLRREAWREYCARIIADDPQGILAELNRLGLRLADLEKAFETFTLYPDVHRWPVPPAGLELDGLPQSLAELEDYIGHMRHTALNLPRDSGNDTLIPAFKRLTRVVSHYDDLSDPRQLMEVLEGHFSKNVKVVQKEWIKAGFSREQAKAEEERWEDFHRRVVTPLLRTWREMRYGPAMRVMFAAREFYDDLRARRGQLNFQDLLIKAAGLLRGSPHVRRYFSDRYTHLLVDEFQDTDPVQAEVILLLTASDLGETDWRRCRPRPGSLFVVGDPKQSIYRFRRADIVTYNEVKQIIMAESEGTSGALVELSANFRTVGPLIDWVNRGFEPEGETCEPGGDGGDGGKTMLRFPSKASELSPAYVELKKGREEGSPGGLSGVFALLVGEGEGNKDGATAYEADFIARFIRNAIDSGLTVPRTREQLEQGRRPEVDPSDFMIITLPLGGLSVYAGKLRKYGVPHQVTGGAALNEVRELRLLMSCLAAVARSDDPVALIAVLRSEAFGVSDAALYRFKAAGGRFDYKQPVPETLAHDDFEQFGDTFDRLRRYQRWLSVMPAISAIENIVSDLGLMVLAGSQPGGDLLAGSLGKALELLREVQHETWTTVQLVDYLGQVVEMEQKYDGISARSREEPAVRVMNLHKVKGLEAPVVFLANAYGDVSHEVDLFVDRSASEVLGFMAVRGRGSIRGQGSLLAHPEGWDALAERETGFGIAEDLRLRYVAATRAGSALIITQRPKPGLNKSNAWRHFHPLMPDGSILGDPGGQKAPAREAVTISAAEAVDAVRGVEARLAESQEPTYRVERAKEFALSTPAFVVGPPPAQTDATYSETIPPPPREGEYGVEWGQAVHGLLELAMRHPDADLLAWSRAVLAENELDRGHAEAAAETVASVIGSDTWKRALASECSMTEVPFHITLEEEELPTLLRGAIDLVFAEGGGWVLVDFKTDVVKGPGDVDNLVSKYASQVNLYRRAWERCTGEKVTEAGLYFTRTGEFRKVES